MFNPPVVDLYNTPGVYNAASYWLSSMVFCSVLSNGRRSPGVWAKQFLLLIVLCLFMTLTHKLPVILFIMFPQKTPAFVGGEMNAVC